MFASVIIAVGGLLLALAAGFFLAVSIGIRRQDGKGGYRSLREEDDNSALSRTGSLIVGLHFANPAQRGNTPRVPAPRPAPERDRTPTTV
ncbi:hypothetical protein ACOQFV_22550 [Nocardiopsis changdeensis]|uniref:Uncharacterized protein n=1 Tax=Nocardiopsis changdeensis TaxID=2831969 RepID=A0ABX8BJX0_9ACTN|nr:MULTISPECIES: hypothetical protein [Nocardiopsis]QUX22030.1 hypothetical protein KGD84_27320 [Nocardiopsis changdeensis]QYX37968.1 hypothetical protein K1J57_04710 [Nocardiopsis sp. MT53]